MAGTGRKWLIGCGVGCAVAALLGILITVGGGILLTRPFSRAVDAQQELTAALGAREDYVPPPAGLTRDQVRRFLAVREELAPTCAEFQQLAARFAEVERLDEEGDPSAGEIVRAVGSVTGAAFGVAGALGNHVDRRNRALLAQDMNLGEYAWIYVLAYNCWLGHPPNVSFEGSEERERDSYGRSERRLLRTLIANHASALAEAGRMDAAERWEEARDRVRASADGLPFAPGELPGDLADALAPFRERLEATYCAESSAFEFSTVKRKGLGFEAE